MVVHYPRTVWKNSYAEHEELVKHTIEKIENLELCSTKEISMNQYNKLIHRDFFCTAQCKIPYLTILLYNSCHFLYSLKRNKKVYIQIRL